MKNIDSIRDLPTTGAIAYHLVEDYLMQDKPVIYITDTDEKIENLDEDIRSVLLLFPGSRPPKIFIYSGNVNRRLVTMRSIIDE